MKTCPGCPERGAQPIANFYDDAKMADGHFTKCKLCVRARVKTHYQATIFDRHAYEAKRNATPKRKARLTSASKEHRARHPDKYKARNAVSNALRDGRLKKGPCAHCGSALRVQAHHADYSKPLDVVWECFPCHRQLEHGQIVTAPDDGRGPISANP